MGNEIVRDKQIEIADREVRTRQVHPLAPTTVLPASAEDRPIATWDLGSMEGKLRLQQVLSGEATPLWDLCDQEPYEFACTDVCVRWASYEVEDGSGEVREGPKIYLLGPDGVFTTGSPSAYRALAMIDAVGISPPWNPAMTLIARRIKGRSKQQYLTIIAIGQSAAEKGGE